MDTTRAAVVTGFHQPLEIRAVPIPELEPGAMLAKVEAATLCGTDVHRWHGAIPDVPLPFIPGHETCGTIVAMDGEHRDLLGGPVHVGDRVLWTYASCGECYWCSVARQASLCAATTLWGTSRADVHPYLLGGLAELQYVPPGCGIVRVPDSVSSASAAAAACAYRTAMHAFERLGPIEPHETIAIQGSGPVGLVAALVARDRGAAEVLLLGAPTERLAVAAELGVERTLDIGEVTDVAQRIRWVQDQTAGRGADVVIQCATNGCVPEGLAMTRRGGRYLSLGVGGDSPASAIGTEVLSRSVSIIPVRMAEPRHWVQALRFLETRGSSFDFDRLISRSYRLDEATEAMRAMASFEVLKPVILPNA